MYNKSKTKGKKRMTNKSQSNKANRSDDYRMPRSEGDINDSSMYYTDENLKNQITNFAFTQFQGIPVSLGKNQQGADYSFENANIMRIALNPSAGFVDPTHAMEAGINMAGLKNYFTLSNNNAKNTNYAPQDVTTLILALGQLIAMVSFGKRAFGLSRVYNVRNRAYPLHVLDAAGIDGSDFIDNLADYRIEFNILINTINKIPFFGDLKYFEKCSNIYSNVYVDQPGSPLAQAYVFVPYSTWEFAENYSEQGTGLNTLSMCEMRNTITFRTYLTKLNGMVNNLLTSTTLNYIYSDVLRVLDKEGRTRLTFTTVPEDYSILPIYSEEIELWINNAAICSAPLSNAAHHDQGYTNLNDVAPMVNENSILYRPQFKMQSNIQNDMIVNFKMENPDIEARIAATRFASRFDSVLDSGWFYSRKCALSDHYVVYLSMYIGLDNETPLSLEDSSMPLSEYQNQAKHIGMLSRFDYAPFLYVVDEQSTSNGLITMIGDTQYYTDLDISYMARLYDAEFISEFELK